MKRSIHILFFAATIFLSGLIAWHPPAIGAEEAHPGYPVVLDSETLFSIQNGIGVLSAQKRAEEISAKLSQIAEDDRVNYDRLTVIKKDDHLILQIGEDPIMAVTQSDAAAAGKSAEVLAELHRASLVQKLKAFREAHSRSVLISDALFTLAFLSGLFVFFWLCRKVFPWIYKKIESAESLQTINIRFQQKTLAAFPLGTVIILFLKASRFVLSLGCVYVFITQTLKLWPYTKTWNVQPAIKSVALLIFYTVLFMTLVKGVNALTRYLVDTFKSWKGTKFKTVKIQAVELLSAERSVDAAAFCAKVLRFALLAALSYIYLTIAFGLFSFSATWSETLVNYLMTPLTSVFSSFFKYLPNLFYITVLTFVFYYAIKVVRFFFAEVEKGNIQIPGFYKDWAMSTFKIVRFMILALALIIIFPYLPGSDSPFFKGISVFLGILFSLGSTSAVANIVAGVVLTYMRPFKIGDRVQIADTIGDVLEKTLLVTRIRTIKNVDITIPNGMVLGSHITNYSSAAAEKGLILHTTVTIGYDAPWTKVHELLAEAARKTQGILSEPVPFVLQKSLDDFYVSYELNAYTRQPEKMAAIYSEMHANIQETFNKAGIEIMSPHYGAVRDGNQSTIPPGDLPKDYRPPSFRLFGVDITGGQYKKDG